MAVKETIQKWAKPYGKNVCHLVTFDCDEPFRHRITWSAKCGAKSKWWMHRWKKAVMCPACLEK